MSEFLVQTFVPLDPALQQFILLGVTAVVSFLLLQLASYLPWLADYLGQYKAGIITWLTGLIVQLANAGLNQIPASWDEVVKLAMQLLAQVIAILIAFALWRKAKLRGSAALM